MDILKYKIVRVVIAIICLVMLFNHLQPTTSAEGAEKVETTHTSSKLEQEPIVTVTAGVGVQAEDDREPIVVVEGSVGVVSARPLVETTPTPEPSSPQNDEPFVVLESEVGVTSVNEPTAVVGDATQPDEVVGTSEGGSSAPGTDEASGPEAESPADVVTPPAAEETVDEPTVEVTTPAEDATVDEPTVEVTTPAEDATVPAAGSLPTKTTVWECSANGQTLFANTVAECDAFFNDVLPRVPVVPGGVGIGSGWSVTVHTFKD